MGWFSPRRSLQQEYEQTARYVADRTLQEALRECRARLVRACYTLATEGGPVSCRVEQIDNEAHVICTLQSLAAPVVQPETVVFSMADFTSAILAHQS